MGIHIAKTMLDEVHYQPGPPNLWRLCKRLSPGVRQRARGQPGGRRETVRRDHQRRGHQARDPRLARHQLCAGSSAEEIDRIIAARPPRCNAICRSRADRQLGRRRAGQALQRHPQRRRHSRDTGARDQPLAIFKLLRMDKRVRPVTPENRDSFPVPVFRRGRGARPRDHQDLPERRRAAVGAVQSPAVRRARASGASSRCWRPSRGSRARGWSRGGRAPVGSRASPRRGHRGHRGRVTRARCSCRGSHTRRGARCTPRRWRRRCTAIAARSTWCSGRGHIPMASRR